MGVVALGAVAVISGIGSMFAGSKSAAKKRAASKQRRKSELAKQFLERRQALQQYRQLQAGLLTAGAASGAGLESSAYQGSRSALVSNIEYNLGAESKIIGFENKAFKLDMKASQYEQTANILGSISQMASSFIGGMGGTGTAVASAPQGGGGTGTRTGGVQPISTSFQGASIAPQGWSANQLTVPGVTNKASEASNINAGAFND